MLKDILAFANAWRRSEAYIVIGAREVKGDIAEITGIAEDIDDAQLQQFVNGKVNLPIEFSYQTSQIDGQKVALITIAIQSRPVYLKKKFGKVLANTVYLRRGSSTAIASPEEIAKMGASDSGDSLKAPIISAFFVSGEHDELRSSEHKDNILVAQIPPLSDFPSYSSEKNNQSYSYAILQSSINRDNSDYYAEFAKYFQQTFRTSFMKFGIENSGNKIANGVRAVIEFKELPTETEVIYPGQLPKHPAKQENSFFMNPHLDLHQHTYKTDISRTSTGYRVEIDFGKVQAKDSQICDESLCLLMTKSLQTKIQIKIFSDDLPEPSLSNTNSGIQIGTGITRKNAYARKPIRISVCNWWSIG
ncbi:MAG: hypothetical protein ACI9SP_001894 [Arenicella sp.]